MTSTNTKTSEAGRLEALWAGDFGDEYVDRNLSAYDRRGEFWLPLLDELQPQSVLEVGCNVGGNLQWITQRVEPRFVTGVDVNAKALRLLDKRVPGVRAHQRDRFRSRSVSAARLRRDPALAHRRCVPAGGGVPLA